MASAVRGTYAAFALAIAVPIETLPALLKFRDAESAVRFWRLQPHRR